MSPPNADRNLLLGLLALHFVTREQLVAAFGVWLLDKRRPLDDILREQGALDKRTQTLLEALTARHLEMHGYDAQRSLAALSSVASARDDLQRLADADLNASLAHVSLEARREDSFATQIVSVGTASAAGTRFRILRPHAKGGLGQVSVALDEELHREVALKEIQAQHSHHEDSRSRFVREAEITGGLEHPGIVPVYGLGTYDDGRPFYAMRFIRGDSLKTALETYHKTDWSKAGAGEQTFALRKLLGRFVDVCNAVAYAHSRGVLHRDLKPGNIMLGNFGETLVVDWGLAKAQAESMSVGPATESPLRPSSSGSGETLPGKVIGTPGYMSPEQAAGRVEELGPATDVYSLGATLYHVLTGRPPFDGRDLGEVLQGVQRGEFPPPRELDTSVPRPLESICLKAMALSPADRYGTPKALAEDVERWLADEPVVAYPEPVAVRIGRLGRRHRGAVRVGAAALAVVAIIAATAAARVTSLNGQLEAKNDELNSTNSRLELANKELEATTKEAQNSVAFLQDLFTTTDPLGLDLVDLEGRYYLSGTDMSALQLVSEGEERLKKLEISAPSRATLMDTVGNAFRGLGQYERAEPLLTMALELRQQHSAGDVRTIGQSQICLANLRHDQGRFDEAETLYRQSIAAFEAIDGIDEIDLANVRSCLAWTLAHNFGAKRDASAAEAASLMQVVIETRKRRYSESSLQVAVSFGLLALIHKGFGAEGEARLAQGQAMAILTGLDDEQLVSIWHNYLAWELKFKLGQIDEAIQHHKSVYDSIVKLVGREHPGAILLQGEHARMLREQGKVEEAKRLAAEAYDVLERSPLRWHPIAVDAVLEYGRALANMGNPTHARRLITGALEKAERTQHVGMIGRCRQALSDLPHESPP